MSNVLLTHIPFGSPQTQLRFNNLTHRIFLFKAFGNVKYIVNLMIPHVLIYRKGDKFIALNTFKRLQEQVHKALGVMQYIPIYLPGVFILCH